MWRTIGLVNIAVGSKGQCISERMWYDAVDRSSGDLVEVRLCCTVNDDMLMYMIDRSTGLKCLQLTCCYQIWHEGYHAITKLPLLEELEVTLCNSLAKEIKAIGYNCTLLKTFKLNHEAAQYPKYSITDEEALAIAETMPQLRHLQLIGNTLTNKGLEAILDSCPHLESLDLCACFHVHLDDNMRERCIEHVKELRWPDERVDEYM
ncbi:hypothetical protein Ancab_021444 [Ancistrocladus abbreviatus]